MARFENDAVSRRRVLVVYNPVAGSKSTLLERCMKELQALGLQVDLHPTLGPGDGEKAAREKVLNKSYEVVVAAGGDGTINEVANGLLGTGVVLGIIPLGTANVLASEMGFLKDPVELARSIAFGPDRKVHVGQVNGRAFLLMVGAGFDGRVVDGVSSRLKKLVGRWAYVVSGLKELFSRSPARIVVRADDAELKGSWVIVSNSSFYGGKFLLTPQTDLESPGFAVSVVTGKSRWSLIRALMEMALNLKSKPGWTQISPVQRITVSSTGDEPAQMDGDYLGSLPLTLNSHPHTLAIVSSCPPKDRPCGGEF